MLDSYAISLFDNRHDNRPRAIKRTWADLCDRIRTPLVRAEKDGALFAPAIFDPPKRAKRNVVEVSMLVLDYDHGANMDRDCAPWRDLELTFAAYTTHSSRQVTESNPDAEVRFRVMIPLLEPIPADKYPLLWQWAADASEGRIDLAAKDASRMFYTPVKCAPDAPYECFFHEGELLDWQSLNLRELPPRSVSVANGNYGKSASKYAQTALEQEVGKVATTATGRNHQLNASAYALGQLVGSGLLTTSEVEISLERAAIACGLDRDTKNGGMTAIKKTIASGLTAGMAEPRVIPERPLPSAAVAKSEPDEITQVEIDAEVKPSPPTQWKRTDLGIAEEFMIRYGDRVRRVVDTALRDTQGFVWWTGTHWAIGPRAIGHLLKHYHLMVYEARAESERIVLGVAADNPLSGHQKEFLTFAKSLESSDRVRSFLTKLGQIETDTHWLNIDDFDRDVMKLNFKNGTVDLATSTLLPHDPADYITKEIPIDYDPNADQSEWIKFLQGVQSVEQIEFLQRWCGYCATGITSEKKFLVTLGLSNTGKSVFWNVYRAALGPYAQAGSVETFEETKRNAQGASEDLAVLRGVRLVVLPEPSENYRLSDALVKRVTGGDPIRARFLNQGGFVYVPQFKIVYYTNFSLRFNGGDTGMQTRYCELGFANVIPEKERDENLTARLIEKHLAGVAAWYVAGAKTWRASGLSVPASVTASSASRLKDQDPLAQFIEMFFDTGVESYRVLVKDYWRAYQQFCAMQGIRHPLGKITLGSKLEERGYLSEMGRTDKQAYRCGLSLKAEIRQQWHNDDDEPPDRY